MSDALDAAARAVYAASEGEPLEDRFEPAPALRAEAAAVIRAYLDALAYIDYEDRRNLLFANDVAAVIKAIRP